MSSSILSLGTVVCLENSDVKLMIIGRGSETIYQNERVYFDYTAVTIPRGLVKPDEIIFFNHDKVDKIIYEGYCDDEELNFKKEYAKIVQEIDIKKAEL